MWLSPGTTLRRNLATISHVAPPRLLWLRCALHRAITASPSAWRAKPGQLQRLTVTAVSKLPQRGHSRRHSLRAIPTTSRGRYFCSRTPSTLVKPFKLFRRLLPVAYCWSPSCVRLAAILKPLQRAGVLSNFLSPKNRFRKFISSRRCLENWARNENPGGSEGELKCTDTCGPFADTANTDH